MFQKILMKKLNYNLSFFNSSNFVSIQQIYIFFIIIISKYGKLNKIYHSIFSVTQYAYVFANWSVILYLQYS